MAHINATFASQQPLRLKTVKGFAVLFTNMATIVCQQPLITRTRQVLSNPNFACFMSWALHASETDLNAAANVVFLVRHQRNEDDYDTNGEPFPDAVFDRDDIGRTFHIRAAQCDEENCTRCELKRGGCDFPFVGPWTCSSILPTPNRPTAEEVREHAAACGCGNH